MPHRKVVSYLRVSTKRQGRSGLGIEAQRAAVADYLNGGRSTLAAEFVEHESGRRGDRPALAAALTACRVHRATLVVAKLDRLSRNAAFLLTLRDAGVQFVAADMPEANELTVGVLALVAEHEARAISERTRAALAAAKRRGVRLGNPANLDTGARERGRALGVAARRSTAAARARDLAPTIAGLRANGATSLRALAARLNAAGIEAPRGGAWSAVQVRRLLHIVDPLPAPPDRVTHTV